MLITSFYPQKTHITQLQKNLNHHNSSSYKKFITLLYDTTNESGIQLTALKNRQLKNVKPFLC